MPSSGNFRFTQTSARPNVSLQYSYRCIVFYDRQANGVVATTAMLLQTATWLAPLNVQNRDRFWVVADIIGDCCVQGPSSQTHKRNVKLDTITTYSDVTSGIASISSGALYILFLTSTGGDANVPTIRAYTRVKFTDP